MMNKQKQIDLILSDVACGRKTIESLVAQKALYEGKSRILTEAITIHRSNPIGNALYVYYISIGEALVILQEGAKD
jgi:hypothetical protein